MALAALAWTACEQGGPCPDSPGTICPVAGTGELGFNQDGKPATESDLYLPSAAKRGPDGVIYVMDFNNQRLRYIDEDGLMRTLAGDGFHALAAIEGPAVDSPLENPIDFDFYSDGRVVFVSYHDPRVLEIDADGILHAVAGAPDGVLAEVGDEGDGGPPQEALFIQLDGIAVGPDDAIYVSDSLANRVRVIRDGIIDTVAGTGEAAHSGDGGPGTEAALRWPSALAADDDGNLFIAETQSHVVRRLDTDGIITTVAGTGVQGFAGDGGPATAAELNQPYGLAVGGDGSIYISDRGNFRVRWVGPDGVIDTIAGTGEEGSGGDGGPAQSASFGSLARLGLQGDELLVADQSNARIRRIMLEPASDAN